MIEIDGLYFEAITIKIIETILIGQHLMGACFEQDVKASKIGYYFN